MVADPIFVTYVWLRLVAGEGFVESSKKVLSSRIWISTELSVLIAVNLSWDSLRGLT